MRAGKMRERIDVYAQQTHTDAYGQKTGTWMKVGTWWAQRMRQSGQISDEAAEHFPDYRVVWRIRLAHRIEEHWQVEDSEGKRYDVTSVERRKGLQIWDNYIEIKCDRINL